MCRCTRYTRKCTVVSPVYALECGCMCIYMRLCQRIARLRCALNLLSYHIIQWNWPHFLFGNERCLYYGISASSSSFSSSQISSSLSENFGMKIAQRQFENSLSFSHKLNGNHLHLLGSLICMNHRNGHIYVTLLLKANESSERSGDPFTYQLCLMDYH